jgi:hypothetical protein
MTDLYNFLRVAKVLMITSHSNCAGQYNSAFYLKYSNASQILTFALKFEANIVPGI